MPSCGRHGCAAAVPGTGDDSLGWRQGQPAGGATEAVGGLGADAVCLGAVPTTVAVLGGSVQKMRARGRTRETIVACEMQPPGESSQTAAAASGGDKSAGTAAESHLAPAGRCDRRTVMTPYPEVGMRRSVWIAEQARVEQELRASVVGMDTVSGEKEEDSERDQAREETLETERDCDSGDVSLGEEGGIP